MPGEPPRVQPSRKERGQLDLTGAGATRAIDNAALEVKGVANDERGDLMSGDRRYLDEAAVGTATAQTASLGPTRELRKSYEADLTNAQQLCQKSVSRAASDVTLTTSRSIGVLFVCLLVVIVTGLLISVWVIRPIAQPLLSLAALIAD